MKQKMNMIGGGFQHVNCSSAFNENKYVEWIRDGSASISIHIDYSILNKVNKNKKNYAWVADGSSIYPDLIQNVLNNIEYFKENFELFFTHDRRIIEKDPNFFKFVIPTSKSWIRNKRIYEKHKIVSFIGSNKQLCYGHKFRQKMIDKYKDKVDHYGRGFDSKELPYSLIYNNIEESGKIFGLKDYMFSFAMSNDNYEEVYCEKITDCFATGTIPIFWGTKNIGNYFDKNGIILLEDFEKLNNLELLNRDLYLTKFDSIKNNLEIVYDLDTAEDYIYLNYIKG